MKKTQPKKRFLVVTTIHKGVFGGYGTPSADENIVLTDVAMCVYWSADVKGVMGLASSGPVKGCRIGPSVPTLTLRGVTAVMEATPGAEKAWLAKPW